MKKDLLKIVSFYGIRNQLKYIHSEYFELDEAIMSAEFSSSMMRSDIRHIAEEIADIMVMLKQIQYYYEITDDEIRNIMQEKIERQLRRINEECHTTSK